MPAIRMALGGFMSEMFGPVKRYALLAVVLEGSRWRKQTRVPKSQRVGKGLNEREFSKGV